MTRPAQPLPEEKKKLRRNRTGKTERERAQGVKEKNGMEKGKFELNLKKNKKVLGDMD